MLEAFLCGLFGAILGSQVTIGIREGMPILVVLGVLSFLVFAAYSYVMCYKR